MRRRQLRWWVVLGTLALQACRCGTDVNPVETRFRVPPESQSVDFGRVLEGTVVTKQVTLIAETRASVSVGASTLPPFSVEPLIDIPGGSQLDLEVAFRAGNGESTGELVLTSGRQEVRVSLRGVGVREPPCIPTAVCRTSKYSLELDRCVETPSPDESPCEPDSQCLEQGRCRTGQCLGIARRCQDNDACTSDACSMDAGCVHTRISCPQPTAPCKVPTCDPRTGCGEATAPDGTPCGPSNCTSVKACVAGACMDIPTPEGTECAPAIACYGVSRCRNQACTRPDAGAWLPTWSARIEGTPVTSSPALLSFAGSLYFTVCGLPAPLMDAGVGGDGGTLDGGADGGRADGGDAGEPDGGPGDAGPGDAGPGDAGPATWCAIASYTSTGFDRFILRVPGEERLAHVGPAGLVLRVDGGLVFRSRIMGAFLGGWETGSVSAAQVAMLGDGGVVVAMAADGGTHLVVTSTMAASELAFVPGEVTHVAAGLDDSVYTLSAASLRRFGPFADGGSGLEVAALDGGAQELLALADDSVVAGDQLLQWTSRGFLAPRRLEGPADAGLAPRDVLVTPFTIFLFFRGCTVLAMSCLPEDQVGWVRAFARNTGAVLWEEKLLPERTRGRVVEASALRLPGTTDNPLAAVVEGTGEDGGLVNGLVVSVDGGRALECEFPDGTGRLAASVFTPGQLLTLATRPDGGVFLEAWSLGALPLETSGWTSAEGLGGQRRPAR
ncbi:MAG: hypothetical protein JNJ54_11695 [Myxococcaceae bacterium]|nr:hypothetical protein [Myxococcaceae bacterium]